MQVNALIAYLSGCTLLVTYGALLLVVLPLPLFRVLVSCLLAG